jgi:hypothetical protein
MVCAGMPQVNLAVQLYPGVVAAPIILGTISGCGGRLLADGIMTGWQVRPHVQLHRATAVAMSGHCLNP